MKRASAALAVAAGFALVSLPALTLAMGSGGMGGGGMPSGGGMSTAPTGPQYDPEVEYQHGTADLQAGKYKDAVNDFEHVTQAAPRSANGWLMLGEAMDGAGDAKGAEKAYQHSVKIDDSSVPAHRELALTEIKLNQMDKAQRRTGRPADQGGEMRRQLLGRRRPEGGDRRGPGGDAPRRPRPGCANDAPRTCRWPRPRPATGPMCGRSA